MSHRRLAWLACGCVVAVAAAAPVMAEPPVAPAPQVEPLPPTPAPPNLWPTKAEPVGTEPAKGVIRHGRAEPIAKPDGAVRVATYNVENFVDHEIPGGEGGGPTPVKPYAHRKAVAEAIHRINADVLALEEVESKETITKFRDEYLADMGYTYIASIDAGDPRGIEQSVLSRFPLKDEKNWPGVPLEGKQPARLGNRVNPEAGKALVLKRSPMRVTVELGEKAPTDQSGGRRHAEVTLFVVHHKSGAYYGFLREAEGVKVVELAKEYEKAHPGAPVIVLGDFNGRMTEASLRVYTGAGFRDAFEGVPGGSEAKEYTSHVSGRTIDHILVNQAAAAMVGPDSRFVLGTPQRPANQDWRTTEPPVGYGSDHYPVVVDLVFGEDSGIRRGLPKEGEGAMGPQPVSKMPPSDGK